MSKPPRTHTPLVQTGGERTTKTKRLTHLDRLETDSVVTREWGTLTETFTRRTNKTEHDREDTASAVRPVVYYRPSGVVCVRLKIILPVRETRPWSDP